MVGKSRVGATNAPVIENVSITMNRVNVIIICTVVGGNLKKKQLVHELNLIVVFVLKYLVMQEI